MNAIEQAVSAVLEAEQARYVRLLNEYLRVLGELAATKAQGDTAAAGGEDEPAGR